MDRDPSRLRVFARDPDTIITMTNHEEIDALTAEFTVRNLPPVEPFVVQWSGNWLFKRCRLDPAKLKDTKLKPKYTDEQILSALAGTELTLRGWAEAAGCPYATLQPRAEYLRSTDKVFCSEISKKWQLTSQEEAKWKAKEEEIG